MREMADQIKSTLSGMSRNNWAFLFCLVFCAALLSSKYLLSLCTIALALIALFDPKRSPLRIRFNTAWKGLPDRVRKRPDIFAVTLIFFTYLIFSLQSDGIDPFLDQLRRKLSFLAWPLIFLVLPPFSRRQYLLLIYFLMVNLAVSAVMVLGIYYTDWYLYNRVVGYGLALPTPMNHIRYSMLISLGIVGGMVMLREGFYWRWKWERFLIAFLVVSMFVYQHFLSVRTGLVLSYAGIFALVLIYVSKSRSILAATLILIAALLLPVFAYQTFPTFKRKVDYTIFDLKKFQSGEGAGYSVAERFRSWQAGLEITAESPLIGLGFPNVKRKVIEYYRDKYQTDLYLTPNNQFISVYSGSGVLGLGLFMVGLLYPLLYRQNTRDPLFFTVYLVFLLSMVIEATLGSYIGSTMFLLFVLFGLSQLAQPEGSAA